jgi:mono/diheme cytochrome c family protein
MIYFKKNRAVLVALLLILLSCQKGSDYMTERQQRRIETAYDSIQSTYRRLITQYESISDSISPDLKKMYKAMQNMHQQMDMNHHQMMSMNMDQNMQRHHNKMRSMDMVIHMQDHMAGEWYQQMISMHNKIADLHKEKGQKRMEEMNHRLSKQFNEMTNMIPGLGKPGTVPFNEKGNPALLNGRSLFLTNCSSCHGDDARGFADVFPPLLNSKWITGDKSIPIRILLNGLAGEININGTTYQGSMPSFKARLSAAEMASILNYIRSLSDGNFSEITQQDVIELSKSYRDKKEAWKPSDLQQ